MIPEAETTRATPATDALLDALRYLYIQTQPQAGVADGRGFSHFDHDFGCSLAEQVQEGRRLSENQLVALAKMLKRYREQLKQVGKFIPTPEQVMDEFPPKIVTITRLGQEQLLDVTFPKDDHITRTVRSLGGVLQVDGHYALSPKHLLALTEALPLHTLDADCTRLLERQRAARPRTAQELEGEARLAALGDLNRVWPDGTRLFPHQQEAVRRLVLRSEILADVMGLGKTRTALVAASSYQLPIVVVAPVNTFPGWRHESEALGIPCELRSWAKIGDAPEQPFVLILDEAHYMQDMGSQRTLQALRLAAATTCKIGLPLTGTPIKNGRPSNLFALLIVIGHPLAADQAHFEQYYCDAKPSKFGYNQTDLRGAKHLSELNLRLQGWVIRRTKDVIEGLPPKIRTMLPLELAPKDLARFIETFTRLYALPVAPEELDGESFSHEDLRQDVVLLLRMRQAGAVAKVSEAVERTLQVIEEGGQVVLFTNFYVSLEETVARLTKAGIPVGEISGHTRARNALTMDAFRTGELQAVVCTSAGGVGINLQTAQTVILLDRPWTPGDAEQWEDRCHRIGTQGTVNSYWLQYGTVDEHVDRILAEKQARIELVLNGQPRVYTGVSDPRQLTHELAMLARAELTALGIPLTQERPASRGRKGAPQEA